MLLYIIRHGDPNYVTDTLTEKGKLQATAVGKRLAARGLDRIYSSPMGRARQTAQPVCDLLGKDYQVLDWTREIWPELCVKRPDGSLNFAMEIDSNLYRTDDHLDLGVNWHQSPHINTVKDAKETMDWLRSQSDAWLSGLGYKREGGLYRIERASDEKVAVFCHAGLTLAWLPILLEIPPHLFWAGFSITHTGVTIIEFENKPSGFTAPRCLCLSDMSHLYADRLPMVYYNRVEV